MNNPIIDAVTSTLAAAAAKYGTALLAEAPPADPDDALRLSRNVLARIAIVPANAAETTAALASVVAQPDAADTVAELREALVVALGRDGELASDLAITMEVVGF